MILKEKSLQGLYCYCEKLKKDKDLGDRYSVMSPHICTDEDILNIDKIWRMFNEEEEEEVDNLMINMIKSDHSPAISNLYAIRNLFKNTTIGDNYYYKYMGDCNKEYSQMILGKAAAIFSKGVFRLTTDDSDFVDKLKHSDNEAFSTLRDSIACSTCFYIWYSEYILDLVKKLDSQPKFKSKKKKNKFYRTGIETLKDIKQLKSNRCKELIKVPLEIPDSIKNYYGMEFEDIGIKYLNRVIDFYNAIKLNRMYNNNEISVGEKIMYNIISENGELLL